MKVLFDEGNCDGVGYQVQLETEKEVELVRVKEQRTLDLSRNEPEDLAELQSHLKVGGFWCYNFKELHEFVQKGVTLTGLPEWLIIK
jgi:hypothetical protein